MRAPSRPSKSAALAVVRMAADSLLARAETMPTGGWAWRSAIQAPHYQTDRDVGAASIGEGLLAAYGVTRDARYLSAATAAGDFLLGIAEPDFGRPALAGLGRPGRTAFDDPLHELRRRGGRDQRLPPPVVQRHGRAALSHGGARRNALARRAGGRAVLPADRVLLAMDGRPIRRRRVQRRRHGPGGHRARPRHVRRRHRGQNLPRVRPRGGRPAARAHPGRTPSTAAGLGAPGSVRDRVPRTARPAPRSCSSSDTPTTTPSVDLETAKRLLGWVNDQAEADGRGGLRWPLAVNDAAAASGFELGTAGIAWVNLQAAHATGDRSYREVARRAGVWLRHVAMAPGVWNELPGDLEHSGSRRARQRRGGDRMGPRGPRRRRDRHCCESHGRVVSPGRCAGARRARPPGHAVVRERDRWKAGPARRAVVALGLRGNRRVCGPPRRVVRTKPGRTAHRVSSSAADMMRRP